MKIKMLGVVALGAAALAFVSKANAEENAGVWFEYQKNPVVVEEEKINEVAPAPCAPVQPCEPVAPLVPKTETRRMLTWRVVPPREWIRVEKECDVCKPCEKVGLTLNEPVDPCGPVERAGGVERRRAWFCEKLSRFHRCEFKRSVRRSFEISVETSRLD